MTSTLAFLGPIGWQELLILAILGLLIFGKRLPEVGRSLGRGIVEFKQGLQGMEDDLEKAGKQENQTPSTPSGGPAEESPASETGSGSESESEAKEKTTPA